MPSYWTRKDERQYQHIKNSELETGRGKKRAMEIAARTVNKQRSAEGRTAKKSTQAADSNLKSLSRADLYQRAQELKISGRSTMDKAELLAALGRH